jgi:hypothetical protein
MAVEKIDECRSLRWDFPTIALEIGELDVFVRARESWTWRPRRIVNRLSHWLSGIISPAGNEFTSQAANTFR